MKKYIAFLIAILSLFCLGPDAKGVTIENLQYPLENGSLTAGFPLGVSNHFVGKDACVSAKEGSLFLVWENLKNPFPEKSLLK